MVAMTVIKGLEFWIVWHQKGKGVQILSPSVQKIHCGIVDQTEQTIGAH
jgi:hypothetical protein